jgi:glycosyltransferase involved in cell wall biosynthesis
MTYRVLVTAGLSDYKLRTKLVGLVENPNVNEIVLIRKTPLQEFSQKVINHTPHGIWRKSRLGYELWRVHAIFQHLKSKRFHCTIGIQLVCHGIQATLGSLSGVPAVISFIGKDVHSLLKHRWTRLILKWIVLRAKVVTIMGDESRRIIRNIGVPNDRIVEIQNFQDPEKFRPERAECKWDLIYVGQLIRRKCIDDLLRAVAMIRPLPSLVIVGDGPEEGRLKRLAIRLGIIDKVDFVGEQSDVSAYLNAAKIFVLVSRTEALPAAAIEAMYCGLPAILTRICDIPSLFKDGDNAMLVPFGRASALVDAIQRLLENDELMNCLMAGAIRTREEHLRRWRIEAQISKWDGILRLCQSEQR